MVIGRAVMTYLERHPKVLKAFHGNSGDSGIATRQAIASILGIKNLLVGEAWSSPSVQGQTVTTARVWGKSCALLHLNPNAAAGEMATFGFTAQFGGKVAGTRPDPNIGLRGGTRVRTGESVKETICAADLGYLLTAVVS